MKMTGNQFCGRRSGSLVRGSLMESPTARLDVESCLRDLWHRYVVVSAPQSKAGITTFRQVASFFPSCPLHLRLREGQNNAVEITFDDVGSDGLRTFTSAKENALYGASANALPLCAVRDAYLAVADDGATAAPSVGHRTRARHRGSRIRLSPGTDETPGTDGQSESGTACWS